MSKTFETNAQKALTMASGIKKHIAEVAHLGIKTEGLDTFERLPGKRHREACDSAISSKRLKWMFSQN
ncbi:MAG: hypothetical protein IJN02_08130 [Bacteroidales bacterium]|nr:hypothetical protein [Bacteroidales bacterium]